MRDADEIGGHELPEGKDRGKERDSLIPMFKHLLKVLTVLP